MGRVWVSSGAIYRCVLERSYGFDVDDKLPKDEAWMTSQPVLQSDSSLASSRTF